MASSSIDIRTEYESWNSGINGKNSAVLFGVGGIHRIKPKWTISGGVMTGSPSSTHNDDSLKRSDMDIAVGFQVRPRITVFSGYRLVNTKYGNTLNTNQSYTDLTHGFGVGISIFQPVIKKIIVYGRLSISGLYSTTDIKGAGIDRGVGVSSGFEGGVTYEFYHRTMIGFALKQQSATIDYRGNSGKWKQNYLRLGFSLSYYF